ncbi:Rz1-like lysis system protein LysC [Serratia fonticola]|uniref:Rz1-like lysis system protein LysC n=1 Tax=Serratia fonticola TaxID=47917 RepID=UPI003AAF9123
MQLKTTSVPLAICLVLLLSSCGRTQNPAPQPLIQHPPESVFTPCEQPVLQGKTWGDAVRYTLELQLALSICSGQVDTLNHWRAETESIF